MNKRRKFWLGLVILSVIGMNLFPTAEAADQYPSKPIKIIVPFGPGGGSDVSMRVYSKYAQEYFKQPIVIANIEGGGGTLGAMEALKARPDGYTLFWHHEAMHVAYLTGVANFGWKAFHPVCQAGYAVDTICVGHEAPWKTIDEFIGYIKSNPGKVRIGATIGATTHFNTVEIDLSAGGKKIVLVSSGGDSDKATKILGGFIDAGVFSMPGAVSFVKGGKIRGLATTGPEKSKFMPDLPAMVERGYDVLSEKNYVVYAPPGLPKETAEIISNTFEKMIRDKRVINDLAVQSVIPLFLPHEPTAKMLAKIEDRYRKIAEIAGIKRK